MNSYSSGQAADKTGFSIDTLRYYERIGLLDPVGRSASGQRRFNDDDLNWLHLLRCLRETEMPLTDMLRFAELCRRGDESIPDRISLLEAHHDRVGRQIERMRERWSEIQHEIGSYRSRL
ncbi:MerR family transcriptional regulator [Actinopolymorpha pittospori]